jgi:signal transduction histidine kinase
MFLVAACGRSERVLALFLINFLALAVGTAQAAAPCGLSHLSQAERNVYQGDGAQAVLLDRAQVQLPDQLQRAWRREDVRIVYHIPLPDCGSAVPAAVWSFRIGAPYAIRADGQALRPAQPAANPRFDTYNGRVPALFALPPQARNLEIATTALPYLASGITRLEHGPHHELAAAARWSEIGLTLFNDASTAVIGVFGLIGLLAWWRRRADRQVLWFGLACALWFLRGVVYQTLALPIDGLLFEQLNPVLVLLTTAALCTSTLHSLGLATAPRLRGLWAGVVGMLMAFALALSWQAGNLLVRNLAFALGFLLIAALPVLVQIHRARQSLSQRLLTLGFVCMLAGGLHDLGMVANILPVDNWSFVTPAFSIMLLCYTLAVSQFLVKSLNRAERANEELEAAIQAKSAQLEASYALLRETELVAERKAAHESARKQEREHLLREMHDGLGAQLMTALRGVERGALRRDQVVGALQDSLDDLRLLMDSTDMGRELQGALATWRNRWDPRLASLGITLDWQVDEALERVALGADAVLQIMRILQEATANAVKHAGCDRILLQVSLDQTTDLAQRGLAQDQATLHLSVTDNGQGLDATAPTRTGGGRGLRNMHNRAQLLGGALSVGAATVAATDAVTDAAPRGTQVQLSLQVPLLDAEKLSEDARIVRSRPMELT